MFSQNFSDKSKSLNSSLSESLGQTKGIFNMTDDPEAIQAPGMDKGIIIHGAGIRQDVYIDVKKNRRVTMHVESSSTEGRKLWICYIGRNDSWSDGSPITEQDRKDMKRNIKASCAHEGYEGYLSQLN